MNNEHELPPANNQETYTREKLQDIAHLVNEELPEGWGFFVMVFPFGDKGEGSMNYVSNGRREDILKLMAEFIKKAQRKN